MKTTNRYKTEGFTIIEVVLVLAIAGLIFLMVFIALPALQRSQRDTQRRNDISMLLSKIIDFQTNNRGALPSTPSGYTNVTWNAGSDATANTWQGFYNGYLSESFQDPRGENYILMVANCTGASTVGGACSGELSNENEASLKQVYRNKIRVFVQASCDGEKAVLSNNPRKVAAQYDMEGSGIYCGST